METLRVFGTAAGVLLLTASSCPPTEEFTCVSFGQFVHNQTAQTPLDVAGWRLTAMPVQSSSFYPDRFRFYDPAVHQGPKDHTGPEVYGEFRFTPFPGKRSYTELTMHYANYTTFPPQVRLLDAASTQVATQSFAATPQNTALTATMKAPAFAHVQVEGGELIVAKVCVR